MQVGDVIAERFEIEALAATGGMGQIFRARDRKSGELVAVKVLLDDLSGQDPRFQHESRALLELSHPNIVQYVAHGVTPSHEAYLAMEWLDGEDLSRRLERAGLSIEESVGLAIHVADALSAAHERGIVHRDLKPSNVFLVGKTLERVKVLDFGIARLDGATRVTRTGKIIGTPGYMAPEQVQNDRPIDARADIFSFGCLLFECVTGTPAFAGENLMALLAKVLFAEPPRLRDVRSAAPAALEQLLLRMMAKDPEERPRDGAAVAEELSAVAEELSRGGTGRTSIALTRGERRTISVVVIEADSAGAKSENETLDGPAADTADMLRKGAQTFGGRLEVLHDGSVIVSIGGAGLATDQAAQAARCALWLHANAGGRAVALATGRSESTGRIAAAEAIDRAVKLLQSRPTAVAIDEMTARLLDGRFDVRETDTGATLHGEREIAMGARLLLKKATPCVGRDRELSTLAQIFEECVEEETAQAALVLGTAGMGKSRLSQELLARLQARDAPMAVWIGRGDVLRAGSALGLLGQALRHACGIRGDEPLPERREKLLARTAKSVSTQHRQHVAEMLGEITGVPFSEDSSELLRAARRNTQIMTDEMRRAWQDFLRGECALQPVLLVLEDLHWGDLPTVQFVDAALRDVANQPWMVLAIARPEVHKLFPKLWEGRHVQEIQLKPLGKKASERLVRQVLGDEIGAETMDRLIAQADGNAFYLEELIRAAAERKDEGFPETVVAMVQSRLAGLDDEDRRALRAAAVFGEAFWPGGVAALLDRADRAAQVRSRLLHLVEREVLARRSEGRFAGEVEFAFRHVLLREGAYAMLTEEDRSLGHRLAGEWLEQAGETNPISLAEHFHRGGEGERAATHYLHASDQASKAGDYLTAVKFSEHGITLTRDPSLISELRAADAQAKLLGGNLQGAVHAASVIVRTARPGSPTEVKGLAIMIFCGLFLRDASLLREPSERLLQIEPERDSLSLVATAFFSIIVSLVWTTQRTGVERYLSRLEQFIENVTDYDPIASAWVELSRAVYARHVRRDFWGELTHAQKAMAHYERSGVTDVLAFAPSFMMFGYTFLGLFDRAEEVYLRFHTTAARVGMQRIDAGLHRAMTLVEQRKFDEASALTARLIRETEPQGASLYHLMARVQWMEIQFYEGAFDVADAEALALREMAAAVPYINMWYLTLSARIRLAQGRVAEAAELVERAYSHSQSCGMGHCNRHGLLLLVRAETFHAIGDHDAARQAIRVARDDLLRRVALIPHSEPEVRRCFLENIPDHRRTLELAREWLGDD